MRLAICAFIYLIPAFAFAEDPTSDLDWRALTHVERFLNREHRYTVLPGHESVVRVVTNPAGVKQKTKYAVLLISGLYNSPAAVRPLEDFFAEQKFNVVNLRLAGHYEANRRSLDADVRWTTWKSQGERALALARELGLEVILVGHSTGALLSTWLAIEEPDGLAGLALWAPAFGLHPLSGALVSLMQRFKFGREFPPGRYVTGHAADQVRQMGRAFADDLAAHDADDPYAYAARRLADIPVWMGNTALDKVIDLKEANAFFAAVERDARARRVHDLRPLCERIIHDRLASGANPQLHRMLRSLRDVIP